MNKIEQWEQERDAAFKAAESEYRRDNEAAEVTYANALAESERELRAAYEASAAECLRKRQTNAAFAESNATNKEAYAAYERRRESIKAEDKARRERVYAKYSAARDAAGDRFERLYRNLKAKEARKQEDAERERQREQQRAARAAELQRKADRRESNAARMALAKQIADAMTPPVVTISPARAASIVGLTMGQFWAFVRSGRYPAPRDDNTYDRDTVLNLPRPKVRVQRVTPSNVLTDILRFRA